MLTNFAEDGMLRHIQKGRLNEEVLVMTSRDMADYTLVKIPTAGMIKNLRMWNFPELLPKTEKQKYNALNFVHQEGNSVSIKFAEPIKVKLVSNEDLEKEFRTPTQSLFSIPKAKENHRNSTDENASTRRPVIKLLRANSSASLYSEQEFSSNVITIEEAQDFDQLKSLIEGNDDPSKIEAQPSIMANAISIDGDQDKEDIAKPNVAFKVPIYHQ